ncbi:NADP-dependent 3-hydroxy acid dehydrogenase YdfG [Rhodospirillales bacterium URHD0017]|nr:NADP-dependent 3-hydroxy acid dehydrogenase YdfG [Rhodospirillales bacterium URHD0017]
MKLQNGQVAVVTGAASGIGFALAEALGGRGLTVVLADVETDALEAARAALAGRGIVVHAHVCDVADAAAVDDFAQAVIARCGKVDLLINNAGVGGRLGPLWDSQPGDWAWTFGVNVFGVAHGVRSFLPAMLQRRTGHVVNVASLAGLTAPPFLGPYVASKHAVVSLSETLAAELAMAGSPIRVSVVCPGHVQSRIADSDRNRPAALATESRTAPEVLARIRAGFAAALGEPMAPADLANRVLTGIEQDEFLILTHPTLNGQVQARLATVDRAMRNTA